MGRRTPMMVEIEAGLGEDLVTAVRRLYYEQDLTLAQIVRRIEERAGVYVSISTLGAWMVRWGIDRAQMARKLAAQEAVA